jgi:hypothetical protein
MQAENLSVAVTSVQPASKTTSLFLGKFRSVLLLIVFLLLIQHAIEDEWSWDFCSALALFSVIGCALLWRARRGLVSAMCSVQFAVVLAIAIALGTALGTFIPQNETIQGLEDRFGESGTAWIQRLFLDDLFHSFWFCGLLALLALSLTLEV